MRNRNPFFMVSVILLAANPAFAMEESEGERAKSLPIPIVKKTDQELPELTISPIEQPELSISPIEKPVVPRKISKTLPIGSLLSTGPRRTSSGPLPVVKKVSPRLSPRQSSGFSPPEGKKVSPRALLPDQATSPSFQEGKQGSPRISVSPRQVTTPFSQDVYSRSPGRDESPIRQRRSEQKSSSPDEQSGSPDLLGSPGRMLIPSSKDRELSPMRERKEKLIPLQQTESKAWNEIIFRERKRSSPKKGMKRCILDKDGNLHMVFPKPIPVSFQEPKIDSPEHQPISSQGEKLDSPKM